MVSAIRVVALNPLIDDTDPIQKFSIDPGSHMDLQNPAQFSPKEKPVWDFGIDPTSSILIRFRTPFLRTPFRDFYSKEDHWATHRAGESEIGHREWANECVHECLVSL